MADIKLINKEADAVLNKYKDQPEVQRDFLRIITLTGELIGEAMTLAMVKVRHASCVTDTPGDR